MGQNVVTMCFIFPGLSWARKFECYCDFALSVYTTTPLSHSATLVLMTTSVNSISSCWHLWPSTQQPSVLAIFQN